jgi:hypothetical protein
MKTPYLHYQNNVKYKQKSKEGVVGVESLPYVSLDKEGVVGETLVSLQVSLPL